ncbi:unnamed protein product [Linum trigynum]|uniref:Uncharacterized protein n=1 Tax=Linum trigynum TaxID=586398 RepID=A0AAV2ESL7_9ROSI
MVLIITYTGTLFLEPIISNYHRHIQFFINRPLISFCLVSFPALIEAGLDITPYVQNLGWTPFLDAPLTNSFCPEIIQLFYSNLQSPGLSSRSFHSLVFGYAFSIHIDDLSMLLNIPVHGATLADESEFPLFSFNIAEEFLAITGHPPEPNNTLPVTVLPPPLRLLHYYIVRVFLLRDHSVTTILPLDIWIISNAVHGTPLNYFHLFFGSLLRFTEPVLGEALPCGPLVSTLLVHLEINLSSFITFNPAFSPVAADILESLEIAIEGEEPLDDNSGDEDTVKEEVDSSTSVSSSESSDTNNNTSDDV